MKRAVLLILLSFPFIVLSGCEPAEDQTGDIAVRLVWPSPAEWLAKSAHDINARSDMPATTTTIRIQVSGADMSSILRDFAASTHRGAINGIPAGNGRRLTIQALNGAGTLLADCKKTGLVIEAGHTTQAGDCVLKTPSTVVEPKMISLSAGCFDMGSPTSEPERGSDETLHNVCVDAFAIGKYEVTFAEYDRFAEATGRTKPDDEGWGRGSRPVINMSWFDATEYVEWLSDETGKNYRLPTEAEWEYAARAGTSTPYSFGSDPSQLCAWGNVADLDAKAVYEKWTTIAECNDSYVNTSPTGQFAANAWGLHDVHGNVSEWTCSKYVPNYDGSEKVCVGKSAGGSRGLRGGTWNDGPKYLRSAYRYRGSGGLSLRLFDRGFRLSSSDIASTKLKITAIEISLKNPKTVVNANSLEEGKDYDVKIILEDPDGEAGGASLSLLRQGESENTNFVTAGSTFFSNVIQSNLSAGEYDLIVDLYASATDTKPILTKSFPLTINRL